MNLQQSQISGQRFQALGALFLLIACLLPSVCRSEEADSVQRINLPDGVRLILKPEPTTEVVAISIFVRTPPEPTRLSDAVGEMVAHALWYGSQDSTAEWVAHLVGQAGGVLETLRTSDQVAITCVTDAGQLEHAANVLCETLKHADFTPEALAHARQDIRNTLRQRADNSFLTAQARIQTAFGTSSYSDQALRAVTQSQAQSYFRSHYVADRIVISVVGGFDPGAAQTDFEAFLLDFDRHATSRPMSEPDSPQISPPAVPIEIPAAGSAAYVLIGTRAPRVNDPDYPAFCVLHALLGSGHSSRLFRRLRDRLGLGYNVGAIYRAERSEPLIAFLQWDTQRNPSAGSTSSLKPPDMLKRLNEQLDAVLSDAPDESEVRRARNMAIGRDALRHERARDRAYLLGWYEIMGQGFGFDSEFPHRLEQVTREDVLRVARKYLAVRVDVIAAPSTPSH